MTSSEKNLRTWVSLAPLIFLLHFLEEAPGFVAWANSYVENDISQEFFLGVNSFVFIVTSVVAAIFWFSPSQFPASIVALWLGFVMFANGALHTTAGMIEGRYVPGLVTASLLYLPYYPILIVKLIREKLLSATTAIALALAGAIPMCVQGYRVFFLGSRLW